MTTAMNSGTTEPAGNTTATPVSGDNDTTSSAPIYVTTCATTTLSTGQLFSTVLLIIIIIRGRPKAEVLLSAETESRPEVT